MFILHHARIILYRGRSSCRTGRDRQTVPAAAFIVQVNQVLPVIAGDLRRAASEFDGGNVRFIVARQRGFSRFNGRCLVREHRLFRCRSLRWNTALSERTFLAQTTTHINLVAHAVGQLITGWKNRCKGSRPARCRPTGCPAPVAPFMVIASGAKFVCCVPDAPSVAEGSGFPTLYRLGRSGVPPQLIKGRDRDRSRIFRFPGFVPFPQARSNRFRLWWVPLYRCPCPAPAQTSQTTWAYRTASI